MRSCNRQDMSNQPSVLRRGMAFFIDLVVGSVIYVIGYQLLILTLATLGVDISTIGGFNIGDFDRPSAFADPADKPFELLGLGSGELIFYGGFLAWGAVFLGAFAAADPKGAFHGQTWGQRAMGLRLMSVYGSPVSIAQAIGRNLPLYALMIIGTWQFTKRVLPEVLPTVLVHSQSAFITLWVSILLFCVPALLYAAFITVIGRGPTDLLAGTEIVLADTPVRTTPRGGPSTGHVAPDSPYAAAYGTSQGPYAQQGPYDAPPPPAPPQMPPRMPPPGA